MTAAVQNVVTQVPRFLQTVSSPHSGVQIWMADLDSISPNDMAELTASLNPAEQARVAQFRFERDRRHFLAGRGIVRRLLGSALNVPASAVVFEYSSQGKPAIAEGDAGGRRVRFNISHAAGAATFALAWDRNLGIDLEATAHYMSDEQDRHDLAMRTLSPRELDVWLALPDDAARIAAFLRAWTRKEAYLKATGKGLFDRLQEIEVALDAADPQPALTIHGWTVHDLSAPLGFFAAIAVER